LTARREGVGGSELAALLGESPYDSALRVWLDKTGRTPAAGERGVSEAMRWGQRLEAAVADAFAEEHGLQVRRAGLLRSRTHPRMLATVDRLTCDGGGLEVKCVGFFTGRQLAGGAIPRPWYWQCLHYLAVTGRGHWWLAVLVGGQQLHVRRLDRDDVRDDMHRAVDAVERFWADHVETDVPPRDYRATELVPVEAGARVEAPLPGQALADATRWRQLERQSRLLGEELTAVKARLGDQLGGAQLLTVAGQPLLRRVQRRGAKRLDVAALRHAQPEVAERFTVTGPATSYLELCPDPRTATNSNKHIEKEEAA
jgi:putative phage-type endonuclease